MGAKLAKTLLRNSEVNFEARVPEVWPLVVCGSFI
jgi:hypothetical protein